VVKVQLIVTDTDTRTTMEVNLAGTRACINVAGEGTWEETLATLKEKAQTSGMKAAFLGQASAEYTRQATWQRIF